MYIAAVLLGFLWGLSLGGYSTGIFSALLGLTLALMVRHSDQKHLNSELQKRLEDMANRLDALTGHVPADASLEDVAIISAPISTVATNEATMAQLNQPEQTTMAARHDQIGNVLKSDIAPEKALQDQDDTVESPVLAQQPVEQARQESDVAEALPPMMAEQAIPDQGQEKEDYQPDIIERAGMAVWRWFTMGNPILRIGAILLFLGFAFLLRYASQHIYFPLEARYALVALCGFALTAFGWFLRSKNPSYALILQGVGIGVFYLTVFAALKLHPLLDPTMAFAILVIVTAAAIILAVLQDSLSLAAAAALGGFAAPVLASSGGGSHIALFSYFLLLDVAILVIAWFKAWRLLNLIGFIGTFGIGTAWGMKSYTPAVYLSTQIFLVVFFVLFVGVAVLFARQKLLGIMRADGNTSGSQGIIHAARHVDYMDSLLFFGAPIIGFAIQYYIVHHIAFGLAYSALALGLFYIAFAYILLRRWPGNLQLLFEASLVLGLIFGSLAIPLGLDAEWTSYVWAVEAAGLYWASIRQGRIILRVFSLVVQCGACIAFLLTFRYAPQAETVLSAHWVSALIIGCSLLFCWALLHKCDRANLKPWEYSLKFIHGASGAAILLIIPSLLLNYDYASLATMALSILLLAGGLKSKEKAFLWGGAVYEIWATLLYLADANILDHFFDNAPHLAFLPPALLSAGFMLSAVLMRADSNHRDDLNRFLSNAFAGAMMASWIWVIFLTVPYQQFGIFHIHGILAMAMVACLVWTCLARLFSWQIMAVFGLFLAPFAIVLLSYWFIRMGQTHHLVYAWMFYQPLGYLGWVLWPLVIIVHLGSLFMLRTIAWPISLKVARIGGAWLIIALLSCTLGSELMRLSGDFAAWRWLGWAFGPALYLVTVAVASRLWPFADDRKTYCITAATPVAVLLFLWVWAANIFNDGSAAPLFYIPVVNPLELGLLIALGAILFWYLRYATSLKQIVAQKAFWTAFILTAFVVLTTAVMRAVHHWADVPWYFSILWASTIVQAMLSIVWAMVALVAMLAAYRYQQRPIWLGGAVLAGITVLKLFTVDLGNSGTLERIVSFIGVGLLFLVVGYFAPLPPRQKVSSNEESDQAHA